MTKKMPNNPFLISGYVSKDYFCDRENDTKNLRSALYNERNVVLISPRRIGKTGLINHLFAEVPTSEAYCIYVDLYRTTKMRDFVESWARGEGNCYDGWMQNPMSAMISCNDGFRPFSFYIEVIE